MKRPCINTYYDMGNLHQINTYLREDAGEEMPVVIDFVDRQPVDPRIVDVLKFREIRERSVMGCDQVGNSETKLAYRVSENVQTYARSVRGSVVPQLTNYGNIMRDFVHTFSIKSCMSVQAVEE